MKTFIFLAIVIAMLCLIEGRKHEKKALKSRYDVDVSRVDKPSSNSFHRGKKHGMGGRMKGRHSQLLLKHHGMKSLHDDWMKVPMSNKDCKLECPKGEFCIVSPRTGEEACVNRRRFKEGRELFKKFHHRKEMFKGDMMGSDMKHRDMKQGNMNHRDKKHGDMKNDLTVAEHMKEVMDLVKDFKKPVRQEMPAHHHMRKDLSTKQEDLLFNEATAVQECRPRELDELKKRLTGYFDMLHTTSRIERHHRKHGDRMKHHGIHADLLEQKMHRLHKRVKRRNSVEIEMHGDCKCSKSVMWDFRKLDMDRDGFLEHEELALMAKNRREPCIKPLVKSCDTNTDGHLTRGEWCCCLADIVAPCAEKARLIGKDDSAPRCDKEGYFDREQCHEKTGYCWCVDLNGNAIPHTKQHGPAHCGKYGPNGKPIDVQM